MDYDNDPQYLTPYSAMVIYAPPPGEDCCICLGDLTEPAPHYDNISDDMGDVDELQRVASEAVIIRACGPRHFFHTNCLINWWCSTNPMINTCPMDRVVAFSIFPDWHPTANNIASTPPGLDIEEHDDAILAELQLPGNERATIEFPPGFFDVDPQAGDADEMPGRGYDEVEDPSGNAADGQHDGFEDLSVESVEAAVAPIPQHRFSPRVRSLLTQAARSLAHAVQLLTATSGSRSNTETRAQMREPPEDDQAPTT